MANVLLRPVAISGSMEAAQQCWTLPDLPFSDLYLPGFLTGREASI
jgi:hypothetical protein